MAKITAPKDPMRKYEVQEALHTLARAQQIKSDPKLMNDVRALTNDLKAAVGRGPVKK